MTIMVERRGVAPFKLLLSMLDLHHEVLLQKGILSNDHIDFLGWY